MRRFWDTCAVVIIGLVLVNGAINLLRPYAWELALAIVAVIVVERFLKYARQW